MKSSGQKLNLSNEIIPSTYLLFVHSISEEIRVRKVY